MNSPPLAHEELVRLARFSPEDMARINECREPHTRLGFAYQLAFIRLHHRLSTKQPLEIVDEILTYVSIQIDIPATVIQAYQNQRRTIINHQQEIRAYLDLRPFGEPESALLRAFLFEEAGRLEQTGPLIK